ncbi:cytochrome c biogenesis protein ResB [Paenibacillus sp. CECT 9249]|uniref:cytochrome c biogenesis protein ResB n=1 Tax=unclassified Paenibacillus TaxID=185978 RepID=UPI001C10B25A|nr:cytochrome c biogenesis protein ResB [Paenibacillus sp. CECT 9249]MBU5444098.1 cytochrome c biogenesis protein ResB [Paenibacillus sp. MSJ-34]CAH0118705.1 Cytochrome c biogenesis protein Ccs1 [Paenibacillus sp. CECT 9249]
MFENTKCECGHQNAVGTVLCEACGKPLLEGEDSKEPLEMRYDGVARKSQKANPSIIDLVWRFFSSVKVAVWLIVITLLASMLGTIYPQQNTFIGSVPADFYKNTYGTMGEIYYKLGLANTYGSWWFITLLVMIGASLVICSLDRVLPLYRALSKQQVRKHLQFITRQKVVYQEEIDADPQAWVEQAVKPLKRKHYKVFWDGTALLAEKNRFSRWGPYINHIGLIIFLLAVLARGIPGWHMDQYTAFPEGEIVRIPDTNFYLKNEKFTLEYYGEEDLPKEFQGQGRLIAKKYETKAVMYECTANCEDVTKEPVLKEVDRHNIIVNDPMNYKGLMAYQFDFDLTPKLRSVTPEFRNKETGEVYGKFELKMKDSAPEYVAGPYRFILKEKYLDFALTEDGKPRTKSQEPNAPVFIFIIQGPGLPEDGQPYMYFPREIDKERFQQDAINGAFADKFELKVNGMENVDFSASTSYLNIRVDKAMPFIWIGAGISVIGLVLGFYWQHRRIWLRIDGRTLSLGAHTNKNWYGMRKEVASFLKQMDIEIDPKSLDN